MSVGSVNFGASVLSQSVLNLKNQLISLQAQLTSGQKSTTYAGMGVNEGFAVAARAQLANISAFVDTMTNITTNIGVANTELQAMVNIGTNVQTGANSSNQTLNSAGQTSAQQTAVSQLSSMLGILNMQSGTRYLFSGTAINTPSTASVDTIMNGTATQAGLKTVIAQRAVADGTTGLGRLVISTPPTPPATSSVVSLSEDAPGSPFGLKLNAVSSSLTGATVTGPSGSPSSISVDLGTTNPSDGDQIGFTFNLPDGTTESIQLTASSATPPPAGSFAIGATPSETATNLNAALNTSVRTLANTSLVAASAVEAGNDFFNTSSTAIGSAVTNQATAPVPVTGATLLSGAAGTNSMASSFADGDTFTVNGKTITFSTSAATSTNANGGVINLGTGSVQDILTAIDQVSGTSITSTASGGVVTLHANPPGSLSVTSSNSTAFAALGFSGGTVSDTNGTATGTVVNSQATIPAPAPITGATLLSGAAGTNSLGTSFAPGNSITVNGQTIQFYNSNTTPPTAAGSAANTTYLDLATTTVGDLLGNIDSITGTSTPSTISSSGVITLHTDDAADFSVTSSNATAFNALGFSGNVTAAQPPLRVGPGSPPTTLVNGAANTVKWYTGNSGPGSARSTSTARVDQGVTVQYGAQANEQAIRTQLQNLAVFAAVTTSPTAANAAGQVSALSSRIALNLSPQPGQQTIQDIQSDFAAAQTAMQDATTRQTQTQATLTDLVAGTENVPPDQVASEILSLQTSLQASYQTTSMLSQLSLTKYLPIG